MLYTDMCTKTACLYIPSLVCPSQGCLEQIAVCDKTAHCTFVMLYFNSLFLFPGVQ